MTFRAWFFGGPLNGREQDLPERRHVVQVPLPPLVSWVDAEISPADVAIRIGTYRIERLTGRLPGYPTGQTWEVYVYDADRERVLALAPHFVFEHLLSPGGVRFEADLLAAALADGTAAPARPPAAPAAPVRLPSSYTYSPYDDGTFDSRPEFCWRCDSTKATTDVGLCDPCHAVLSEPEDES